MGPSQRYDAAVRAGERTDDPAQRAALVSLDRIAREVRARADAPLSERIARLFGRHKRVKGLYLWGGVGRGKTFLMDLLHESMPPELCVRLHFHRFMGRVHGELAKIRDRQDPLEEVAKRFAERPLLCLDEFFVQDIAMILSALLKHLMRAGATLVTTSNIPPKELYRDGLQRAKFLPAIARIERNCEVLKLDSPTDYRLRALTAAPVYHAPAGPAADEALAALFARVAPGTAKDAGEIAINHRAIAIRRRADGVAWFDFDALCEGPRAVADYIEIAKSFNTVLVSNVPRFDAFRDDAARRFVHLVDELYDRNVNLALSAAVPILELYAGERLALEFQRTQSRLLEMQSEEYLAREHRP
jgi:cell division protein ZapE